MGRAAPAEASEGAVLAVGEDELIVELGEADGVAEGESVRIYRRVALEHPLSGELVEDRFPIGEVVLDTVGEHMSLVHDWSALTRQPAPGDAAVTDRRPAAPEPGELTSVEDSADSAYAQPPPEPTVCDDADPDAASVAALFDSLIGQPLTERVVVLSSWLADNPDNDHRDGVGDQLD